MDNKVDGLKARYKETLAELYLDRKICYSPEIGYVFVKGMHSFGGYHERTLKRGISSDVDDTLTVGESLTVKWIYRLSEINGLVRRNRGELLDLLGKISFLNPVLDKLTIDKIIETVGKKLAECGMSYEEYKEASSYAAREVELAPYSIEFIRGLDRMGYIVSLNSGSPEECVVELGKKLNITRFGIGESGVYKKISGSDYDFKDTRFTGKIRAGLGFNKGMSMRNFLSSINCSPTLSIFISDDPRMDAVPASMAGLSLWTINVSKLDRLLGCEFPGEIKIICPEAKNDMNILLNYIKRWDLLNIVTFLRTPEAEKMLYNLVKRFKNTTENGLNVKEDFYTYKNGFLDIAHQLLGIIEPIFNEKNLNIFEALNVLEMSENMETDKSLMKDIFNRFSYRIPEIQAPEKLGEELNSIVEEKKLLKDLDLWFPW